MSYIVKVDEESSKYYVTHTAFPGVKAKGHTFYGAIEAMDRCLEEKRSRKTPKQPEEYPIENGIIALVAV